MRRKDREVTDPEKIQEILASCTCIRLGFNDDGQVYIVPLNYGFLVQEGSYVFYFHGAKEGRKIDLIRKNPYVGFELDNNGTIKEAEVACRHSTAFQSILGNGYVSFVEDPAEKELGLSAILQHNTGRGDWTFPEAAVHSVCVFKMVVEQLSCKEHL